MNSANACWVHSISIEGLQPWLADKSSLDIERRVSISLVPKCSGVSPSSVWRQGLNAESSPLLQRLLMHFASGSHWSKPEVQFGKGARTDFFFCCFGFFFICFRVTKLEYCSWFWVPCPCGKGSYVSLQPGVILGKRSNGSSSHLKSGKERVPGGTLQTVFGKEFRAVRTLSWQTCVCVSS